MESLIGSCFGAVLVSGGLLFLLASLRSASADEVSLRLRDYVDRAGQPAPRLAPALPLRQSELAGSFRTRILVPWIAGLGRLFGRLTPARVVEGLRRDLARAGNPLGLGPREYYGVRLMMTVVGLGLAFSLARGVFAPASAAARQAQAPTLAGNTLSTRPGPFNVPARSTSDLYRLFGAALVLLISARLPSTWLRGQVRRRQDRIRKALPDALDMLSVCAEAGLGFDQALLRLSEKWNSPLAVELGRVVAEMQMGVPRQTALRNLAARTDVTELSSFVAVIIQSDQLGMSIADTLRGQAEQMRLERRYRAQEAARKMPLKMLFPMMLLMLPAMFGIILGPVVPVIDNLFTVLRSTGGR